MWLAHQFRIGWRAPAALALVVLAAFQQAPALADSEVYKAPIAGWVDLVDIPKADPRYDSQIRNGISHLLSECQIRQVTGGYEVFDRYAYKIVDRTGLEGGATVKIEFDPATSNVTLSRLHIVRDGVVIDRLPGATLDIFRREKDAEKGLFDGWLTAYANVEDVRVGDIVDYAVTTVKQPIVGPELLFHSFALAWTEPVALIRERVTWPTAHPLTVRHSGTDAEPVIEKVGADTVYSWQSIDPPPLKDEDYVPADVYENPVVEFSSASSWQEVVDAFLPYYRLDQPLPAGFAGTLDAIAAANPAPEDRMIAAMRLVQDTIRYVSLSMGKGSYIPRAPATVVTSGFGDCKDKALLLALALRRLGVEAEPALTDLDEGLMLGLIVPTIRAFDHVIVKASIGGRTYWIDATNYLQGGRAANLVQPSYGFALPLVPHTAMEAMPASALIQPTTSVSEQFEFPLNKGDPLRLKVETVYRDADADTMRFKLISQSTSDIADKYLQYYNRQYPGMVRLAPLSTTDDRDGNVVTTTESYELSADLLAEDALAEDFPLKSDVGVDILPQPDRVGRRNPVNLGTPTFRHYRATVKNLKAKFVGPEDNDDVITPYVAFKARWSSTSYTFQADWYLKVLTDRVPAAAINAYLKSLKKISDNSTWTFNFAYSEPTTH